MKRWKREWKIELIKENNPEMHDLAHDWFTEEQLVAIIEEYKRRKLEP